MSIAWTIAGESGKAWDATALPLDERGVTAGTVTVGSLDQDKVSLTQVIRDRTAPPAAPDHKQRVTLYRNGTAFFRGWATSSKITLSSAGSWTQSIEISGAWWHLKNTPMVGSVNHAAFSSYADRNQFVAAYNAQVSASLASLVAAYNRRFPEGDARRIATVFQSASYPLMEVTLSNTDFLTGVSELAKYVPDMMGWWDNAAAVPVLYFTRRADAPVRSLVLGTASVVSSAEFNPRADLDGSDGVRIDYAEVDASGNAVYKSQSSSGAGANCQVLTVSGPELGGVPVSVTTTTNVATTVATTTATNVVDNTTATTYELGMTPISIQDAWNAKFPGLAMINFAYQSRGAAINVENGGIVNGNLPDWRLHRLNKPTMPDWARDMLDAEGYYYYEAQSIYKVADWFYYNVDLNQSSTYPWGSYMRVSGNKNSSGQWFWAVYALSEASWRYLSSAVLSTTMVNLQEAPYNKTPSPLSFQFAEMTYAFLDLPFRYKTLWPWKTVNGRPIPSTLTKPIITAVSNSVSNSNSAATSTTKQNYEYAKVPPGLAGNLAAAQNWTPMEGVAKLRSATPGGTVFSGCRITVSGGPPTWENMVALVKSHQVDLFTGRETISCGVPSRFGAINLVKKLANNGESNIVYL